MILRVLLKLYVPQIPLSKWRCSYKNDAKILNLILNIIFQGDLYVRIQIHQYEEKAENLSKRLPNHLGLQLFNDKSL